MLFGSVCEGLVRRGWGRKVSADSLNHLYKSAGLLKVLWIKHNPARLLSSYRGFFNIQDWVYTHIDIRWSLTSMTLPVCGCNKISEKLWQPWESREIVHTLRDIFSDRLHGLAAHQFGTCICAFFSDVRPSAGAESKQSIHRLFILCSNSLRLKIDVMIFSSV